VRPGMQKSNTSCMPTKGCHLGIQTCFYEGRRKKGKGVMVLLFFIEFYDIVIVFNEMQQW
jgi:hypothetical protein